MCCEKYINHRIWVSGHNNYLFCSSECMYYEDMVRILGQPTDRKSFIPYYGTELTCSWSLNAGTKSKADDYLSMLRKLGVRIK